MATRADPWQEARQESFVRHQREKAGATQETAPEPTDGADAGATTTQTDTSTAGQGSDADAPPQAAPGAQDTATLPAAGTDGTAPPEKTEAAPADAEAAATEPPGLAPETLSLSFETSKDQLLATDAAKKWSDDEVTRRVQQRSQEFQDTQREDAEVAALIQQGSDAYQGMLTLLESARTELNTAAQGTEDVKFNPNILDDRALGDFDTKLQTFGSAIVAEQRGNHRRDLDQAFIGAINTLPAMSDAQRDGLRTILNNARRMERDPQQSPGAFRYALTELVAFVTGHARAVGATEESVRVQQRSQLAQKVASSNVAKAAAAKLAAARGNISPDAPADAGATSTGGAGEATQAYYEARKRAGAAPAELDQIVAAMSRRVASGASV